MAPAQKAIIEDWGKWVFRGIITTACYLIYFEAKEIRGEVKTLMEERGTIQLRVGRTEKDIEQLQSATTNIWNRIVDHEVKHKR